MCEHLKFTWCGVERCASERLPVDVGCEEFAYRKFHSISYFNATSRIHTPSSSCSSRTEIKINRVSVFAWHMFCARTPYSRGILNTLFDVTPKSSTCLLTVRKWNRRIKEFSSRMQEKKQRIRWYFVSFVSKRILCLFLVHLCCVPKIER